MMLTCRGSPMKMNMTAEASTISWKVTSLMRADKKALLTVDIVPS